MDPSARQGPAERMLVISADTEVIVKTAPWIDCPCRGCKTEATR